MIFPQHLHFIVWIFFFKCQVCLPEAPLSRLQVPKIEVAFDLDSNGVPIPPPVLDDGG